jgi:PAS domain S-box-containing protein
MHPAPAGPASAAVDHGPVGHASVPDREPGRHDPAPPGAAAWTPARLAALPARAAEALLDRETRLELALDVAELGTWSWDLATNTGDIDARGAEIVGLSPGDLDDVVNAQLRSIHPDDLVRTMDAIGTGIAAEIPFTLEYRAIHPDGSVHHVLSRARVVRGTDGEPARLVGTNRDVTAERTRDADREDLLERERRGREAAEAFLAVMSHELRTPITSIYGTASVLQRDPGRPDAGDLLGDVVDEAERLRRITDDLLVLSGVERGSLQLDPEPVRLERALVEPLADVRRRYPGVEIEPVVDIGLPLVSTDPTALRQVIYNLVSNAAKYAGAEGPVHVQVTEADGGVEVRVLDRGPGPGPDPEALFGLFYRAPHTERRASGTGIGLYVAAALLAAMGSRITAEHREGGGAAFRFTLPLFAGEG